MKRALGASIAAACLLGAPTTAVASISSVFAGQTISGTAIPCQAQSDGVRVCHGTDGGMGGTDLRLKTFDAPGAALEAYVILPPVPSSGPDGGYPLVVQSHGWGGSAGGPGDTQYYGPVADTWAKDGYAVLQLTARGFGDSCGKAAQQAEVPTDFVPGGKCGSGYIRLDDTRYEVRDIQQTTGLLVDTGIADPNRIGLTGESYGGGVSLQLATLKDRVMNADGTLSPWKSPGGTPLHIAAATPVIPWSDLVNSLLPNGRTLDYQETSATDDLSPIGVLKQSYVTGLFALGASSGFYSTTDSAANLPAWYAATNAGEPYDQNPQDQAIVDQIARFHSAYYLLDGKYGTAQEPPPPLLIANGFTDDLFPVDEAVRYYNYVRNHYPGNTVNLFDGDFGHQRAQNKKDVKTLLSDSIKSFFDYNVKGTGSPPPAGVTASTETCPSSAPSGGPFTAQTWDALHPGEVDYSSKPVATISSSAGDPTISRTFDPVSSGGAGPVPGTGLACATAPATVEGSGVAMYQLPEVKGSGFTLLGAPTVIANVNVTGQFPFIAARLLDIDKAANKETLVARGVYRIDANKPNGLQVFQLHPGAWHFAAGHIPELQLLGRDAPYLRTSNGQFSIAVNDLQLRLPVHEPPGSNGGVVTTPKPPVKSHPHAVRCGRPVSQIGKAHGSRHKLNVQGTAGEQPCAHASKGKRRREHVTRVLVIVYSTVGHGRCRFVTSSGRLSRARSCNKPIALRARGTKHWTLQLKLSIPAGRYHVRSIAVDAMGRRQRSGPGSVVIVRVR